MKHEMSLSTETDNEQIVLLSGDLSDLGDDRLIQGRIILLARSAH